MESVDWFSEEIDKNTLVEAICKQSGQDSTGNNLKDIIKDFIGLGKL